MSIKPTFISSFAAILILSATAATHAGQISGFSWFSGVASVAGTTVFPPVAPNNDDVVGDSPNPFIVTQKHYTGIGPVDLVFDVLDTGGVTEYRFQEGVQNSTGFDWTSYHLELGFGNGAGFVKSTLGDGLDFDSPDFNSTVDFAPFGGTMPFPTVTVTEDDIFAGGGVQPDFAFAGMFIFHVDVPDGITEFTIRQSPIVDVVPEPATFVTLAGLLACLGLRRREG